MVPTTQPPVVSVLIPTHDRPAFLQQAIDSVLANGFADFEIVVSDDGPEKLGAAVVQEYADPRIRYCVSPEMGRIENSTNASLHAADSRYHFKLDDDDIILPGFLAACVAFLESRPNVAVVFTGYRLLAVATGAIRTVIDRSFFIRDVVDGWAYIAAVLTNEGGYPQNQKTAGVYRAALARSFGFYSGAPEDFAFTVALATRGDVGYLPEPLYEWRSHEGSSCVQDLFPMYRRSLKAIRALRSLSGIPDDQRASYLAKLDRCGNHLALYYLFSQRFPVAWAFYRRLPETGMPWARRVSLLPVLLMTLLVPPQLRDRFKHWYAAHGNHPMFVLMRRVLS